MLQRTQSLWLLFVVVCGILTCCFPVITLDNMESGLSVGSICQYQIDISGLEQTYANGEELDTYIPVKGMTNYGLMIISIVIPLIAFVTIFLFKHRILQARLCVINVILMLGYYAIVIWYTWLALNMPDIVHATSWRVEVPLCLPLVSIVLTLMALRGILKDEALVRSMDGLR